MLIKKNENYSGMNLIATFRLSSFKMVHKLVLADNNFRINKEKPMFGIILQIICRCHRIASEDF